MTKLEKVKAIYQNLPELVNDDIGLIVYLLGRFGYPGINLEEAMRKMGNPEHWTRQARLLREKDQDIINLVDKKVEESRSEQAVDYRYNAEAHLTKVPEYYTDENGREYITFKENN
jgi:hypothetical protein